VVRDPWEVSGLLMKGDNILESKTITIPKSVPLTKRISEVNKQISEWLRSLDRHPYIETDDLRLSRCEQNHNRYIYHYEILADK